jgi:hypothetical protein
MKIHFDGDAASLKKAGEKLKANPNVLDDLAKDPQGFLRNLGLEVDNETAKAIQSHAQRSKTSPASASAVHIDV